MEPNDLEKILKEIPILLVNGIIFQRDEVTYQCLGLAVKHMKDNGKIIQYTVLDYNCDDLANGLLHESLHHYHQGTTEQLIEDLTDYLWDEKEYKKLCQKKIVELCDRWGL